MSFLYVFALFCLMMGNAILLKGCCGKDGCLALLCEELHVKLSVTLCEIRVTMKLKLLGISAILFR